MDKGDGTCTTKFADIFHHNCFVCEAKQGSGA